MIDHKFIKDLIDIAKLGDPNAKNFYTDPENFEDYCGWGNEDDSRDHGYEAGENDVRVEIQNLLRKYNLYETDKQD